MAGNDVVLQTVEALRIGAAAGLEQVLVDPPGSTQTDTPSMTTRASHSAMIVALARGDWTHTSSSPFDNKGNTYATLVGPNAYSGFPDSQAGIFGDLTNAGGAGHIVSATRGLFNGGPSGDEQTIMALELHNVDAMQSSSFVERGGGSVNQVFASLPVTTTGPAILVLVVGGTGNTGLTHPFNSQDGYTKIPALTFEGDPSPVGYIQFDVFYKVVQTPGTYTASIQSVSGEGALVFLCAFQNNGTYDGINDVRLASTATLNNYVLTAGAGTVVETGASAGLLHGYRVVAVAGAIAETGSAATLEVGHRLSAASGTVVETGAAAALKISHDLIASSGTITEIGAVATLETGHRIIAGGGAIAETGTAATKLEVGHRLAASGGAIAETGPATTKLEIGHRIAIGGGTFVEAGTAATLEHGYRASVASGAIAETGATVNLVYTPGGAGPRTLTATGGVVAETGAAATLRRGYPLTASSAAVAETGAAVALRAARRISVASGTILDAGAAASLRIARRLAAANAACLESGASVGLRASRRIPASSGAIAESGTSASTRRSYIWPAGAGAIAMHGVASTLTHGHPMSASVGVFTLTGRPITFIRPSVTELVSGAYAVQGGIVRIRRGRRAQFDGQRFGSGPDVVRTDDRPQQVTQGASHGGGANIPGSGSGVNRP